jgi:hypothetical protein
MFESSFPEQYYLLKKSHDHHVGFTERRKLKEEYCD